ncbi:MAG: alkaline phosphatase D family protein [Chitinophagales bacterium]
MKKIFTYLFLATILVVSCKKDKNDSDNYNAISKITFGSCSHQFVQFKEIFTTMLADSPDLHIAGGDNIYGDFFALAPGTKDYIESSYEMMWNDARVSKFYSTIPTIATWDDHDFGENDGVKNNPVKAAAKNLFFQWWQIPIESPRRHNPDGGIYGTYYYGDDAHKVQVIMLDLRWNHDPYKAAGPAAALGGYDTIMTPGKGMMGETQWTWLKSELLKPAKIRIIMSSLQFSASYNGGEAWSVFPLEQQRMYDLIQETRAEGIFFLSGDVHFADFNKQERPGVYPLWDFTSSGLTHYEEEPYPSDFRVGEIFNRYNYGCIDIDWDVSPVTITVSIKDYKGEVRKQQVLTLDDLKF